MSEEINFIPLGVKSIRALRVFFRDLLDSADQQLFMPHPKVFYIAFPIYFYLFLSQILKKSHYELAYLNNESESIGLILLRHLSFGNQAELGIAIASKWQGKGLSAELMNRVFEIARGYQLKKIYLTVSADNLNAIILYQKFKFEKVKTIKKLTFSGRREEIYMVCYSLPN
jgi:RimJ/RimL family protein N-acetyltransferase